MIGRLVIEIDIDILSYDSMSVPLNPLIKLLCCPLPVSTNHGRLVFPLAKWQRHCQSPADWGLMMT